MDTKKILIIFLAITVLTSKAFAIPALEFTQHANFTKITLMVKKAVESVNLLTKTINSKLKIIEDRKAQAMKVTDSVFIQTANCITDVTNTINRTYGLVSSLKDIDREFKNKFKGYEHWLKNGTGLNFDFSKKYKEWEKDNTNAAKSVMKVAGLNLEALADDRSTAKRLKVICRTARGRNALLKANTMLKTHQNDLMQRLLTLLSQQSLAQGTHAVVEEDKNSISNAKNYQLYHVPEDNMAIVGDGIKLADTLKPIPFGAGN